MRTRFLISFAKSLEDPRHPLLGPNLKALYWGGMWQIGSKLVTRCHNFSHFVSMVFIFTEFIELFNLSDNINKMLNNLSVTALSLICGLKCISFVMWQKKWKGLIENISEEEILEMRNTDVDIMQIVADYTKYSRTVSYLYWILAFISNLTLIAAPFFIFLSASYRKALNTGDETYPEILSCWIPFDKTRITNYVVLCIFHALLSSKGALVVAVYDSNAVAIMIFLKGQIKILRKKCENIFENTTSVEDIVIRIKECHRHHNFLMRFDHIFLIILC